MEFYQVSAFPGHPQKAVKEPEPLVRYKVEYDRVNYEIVKAHYVQWGSAFVRFYEKVSDTHHVLVVAINNANVREVSELTDAN